MEDKRIDKIENLLDKYYESEDSFEQTDFAIELIQNHLGWLIGQAKKVSHLEEYIGQFEHEKQLLYGRLNMIRGLTDKEIK